MKLKSLSIILPCFNEAENIAKVAQQALEVGNRVSADLEIIVINDGSRDQTLEVAQKLAKKIPQIVIVDQENQGYGGALMSGFQKASKDWLFFTDADLQFDLTELEKFISETQDYDFIFGYREKRADKFHRILIAKLLKIWNKVWLNFPMEIKDIDCAFKLMRRASFLQIGEIQSRGAMINTELILRVRAKDYEIKQLPVQHYQRINGQSTGSDVKVITRAIRETFQLIKILKLS